jgi:hypothetical protein
MVHVACSNKQNCLWTLTKIATARHGIPSRFDPRMRI